MAVKANRLKSEIAEAQPEIKEKVSSKKITLPKFDLSFFKDKRTHFFVGLFLVLLSLFLFFAFTSFIFTWKADYSEVSGSWWNFLLSDSQAANWLGKFGALMAHSFIHNGFGLASFAFVVMFFVTGLRVAFKIQILPLGKTFSYSFFSLIFLSTTAGFLFDLKWLGGSFGYFSSMWLTGIIGSVGTGILLFFSLASFAVIAFNLPFEYKEKPKELSVEPEIIPEKNNTRNSFIPPAAITENDFEPFLKKVEKVENEPEILVDEAESEIENIEDLDDEDSDEEELEDDFSITENFEVEKPLPEMEISVSESDVPLAIETIAEEEISEEIQKTVPEGEYDPTLELSSYKFPTLDLLENYGTNKIQVDREELEENKNKIVETLGHYNIDIDKIKATIGPTVTLYEIVPKAGVRISKIKNLEDDIALSLAALGIRIIAPIPGKGTIGIEVPNQKPEVVAMKTVLGSEKFQSSEMDLPIGLGKTISNEVFVTDLAKMPHLLMAGSTGQGKSVGLNAILVSLLYKKHPSQVKFVLVDPKKVELTLFKTIERHFLAKLPGEEEAIITDTKKVINTLNSLCIEMDQRYELLKDAQVRNIKEYNAKFVARRLLPTKGHRFLPYIVLVVDEFADLIMTAGKEVELPIARLAQLARAIGIHLIIATQRPSVNIITGTIKANFPARIAFRVTSKIDSRTILDAGGADQLIGRGDLLLSTGADLIRIQCAFVDTPEVERITEFIGSQRGYADAFLLPEYVDERGEGSSDFNSADKDAMFEDAARIIVQNQQGSASLLQRRLKLGYNRAGRIIDQLEAAGIIGPFEGSKAREVLISDEHSLEEYLSKMR